MMRVLIVIAFIGIAFPVFSQVKSKDLAGKWTACNKDSTYYKSETVLLYQDANYSVQSECCYYVSWNVESKKRMKIENSFVCTEPGRVSSVNEKETFKVQDSEEGQEIVLKRGGQEIDRFRIVSLENKRVDRYPYDIKILTLKRL